MIASGEAGQEGTDVSARRIATPKSRKGRFSDAHKAEFSKMDSIAQPPLGNAHAAGWTTEHQCGYTRTEEESDEFAGGKPNQVVEAQAVTS